MKKARNSVQGRNLLYQCKQLEWWGHASNDALRVGGCASTRTGNGEDQSKSDQMGEVTQHI